MDDPLRNEEAGLPPEQRQRRSAPSFIFLMLMLFLLTSHNGDEFLARHQYQHALQSLNWQLSNFTAWMNGTESNFTLESRDSHLESLVQHFLPVETPLDPVHASYYPNITGFMRGEAMFHNITPAYLANDPRPWSDAALSYMADTNLTDVLDRVGMWNWTATTKIALSIGDKKVTQSNNTNAAHITGRLEITDDWSGEDLNFDFDGIHFPSNGTIYGFAEPYSRPIDIRLLPSLVPEKHMNETSRFVEPELAACIQKLKNMIDAGVVETDNTVFDVRLTTCPFALFAQVEPSHISEAHMQALEEEMLHPAGAPVVKAPRLKMNALLVSKECGLMLELKNVSGLRSPSFFRKVTTYAGTASIVYFILLCLLSRQMERSRTPAGLARASRWTFFIQAIIDSVSFAGHITFAIIAEGRPSLSLTAPAFLSCAMFVYEAQFSILINQIQLPEDQVSTPSPATPTTGVPAQTGYTLPTTTPQVPVANAAPVLPQSPTFWAFAAQHLRTDPSARLWLSLFVFVTFIVRVILSPFFSLLFVAVTYSLIWLSQILRSIRRGRSSGLTKEYVIGNTVCRLYLALYFLLCPTNVLEVEPRAWAYYLAAFVSFQALVVILQSIFGPTFFVPARYAAAKAYDYHPMLPLPDPEAPEQSLGDCAICMDAIQIDSTLVRGRKSLDEKHAHDDTRGGIQATKGLLNAVQVGVGSAVTRKSYSLAPCSHLFHTECLEKWLAIKNICPQCRRPLPPL